MIGFPTLNLLIAKLPNVELMLDFFPGLSGVGLLNGEVVDIFKVGSYNDL